MATSQQPTRSHMRLSSWTNVHPQAYASINGIIQETENYLTKIFGYPKSFLKVLAKASFGCDPVPVVEYDVFITKTWKFLNNLEDIMNSFTPISGEVTICTGSMMSFHDIATQTDDENKGSNVVQITAGSDEVQRRIHSFIRRKRQEVDAYNRREFCVFRGNSKETTCARTDAAFVPRHGRKSLLKTYRVYNKVDASPQRKKNDAGKTSRFSQKELENVWEPTHPSVKMSLKHLPPETYERIENIDQHLTRRRLTEEKGSYESAGEVLSKVKELENRILYLEGISPEYHQIRNHLQATDQSLRHHPYKKQKNIDPEKDDKDVDKDVASLDKRIMELKQSLLKSNTSKIT